jgi:hypothetical protein
MHDDQSARHDQQERKKFGYGHAHGEVNSLADPSDVQDGKATE